ncbi:uracil-DNA glycosylase family protein [Dubosiella newyorkensis]|uniref:DNA-deoxyinosine glycosylase n=1 Tax=Dubosiella newyorkensis TaxID=1862672 RepID=A0A1U7NQ05_9FIRM|nr:uracil-DNA glycosylase family protein [Dubosiella newyorkensis]OLU47711.1 hypothetical protein BO225_02400 [Dubosiella newyorkensis]
MYDRPGLQLYKALPPLVFENSRYLFLVTMPSVKAEEAKLYFGDPSNHFWDVLSAIYDLPVNTKEEKLALCQQEKIAITSIVASCLRHMSEADTMEEIQLNDIQGFLEAHPTIDTIICVSHRAKELLERSNYQGGCAIEYVPSPSGADLDYESVDKLLPKYKEALGV